MNILFLTHSCVDPTKGGVQKITYALLSPLREYGASVYILSFDRNGEHFDNNQYFFPNKDYLLSGENIVYLQNLIIEKSIDIVINQQGISISFMKLVENIHNIKIISVMHNSLLTHVRNAYYIREFVFERKHLKWLIQPLRLNIFSRFLCKIYNIRHKKDYSFIVEHSDKIVILSSKLESELNFFMDRNKYKSKVIVIPNFVDSVKKINIDTLLKNKRKKILYVGRIDFSMKRVDLLLKVWRELQYDFLDWELDIVGGNENDTKFLSNLLVKMKLQRVNIYGFVSPEKYYREASVYCMTSCAESFGMVLIEAMSFGVVPIAFNSYPTITDIIDNNVNGILVDKINVGIYAKSLSVLMENEVRRKDMARNAYEKSFVFSKEKIIPQWKAILNI